MISLISVAPASTAFSKSSFTADAGRCITSPAAIWLAILSGSNKILSGTIHFSPVPKISDLSPYPLGRNNFFQLISFSKLLRNVMADLW